VTRSRTASCRRSSCWRAGTSLTKPLVVRLDGNNAEEGRRILDEAGLAGLERVDTMDGAAKRAAELAAK